MPTDPALPPSTTDPFLFVGWVPTVTGVLSFSNVGATGHPVPSVHSCRTAGPPVCPQNSNGPHGPQQAHRSQFILCAQRRPLSDSIPSRVFLKRRWLSKLFDIGQPFLFVLSAYVETLAITPHEPGVGQVPEPFRDLATPFFGDKTQTCLSGTIAFYTRVHNNIWDLEQRVSKTIVDCKKKDRFPEASDFCACNLASTHCPAAGHTDKSPTKETPQDSQKSQKSQKPKPENNPHVDGIVRFFLCENGIVFLQYESSHSSLNPQSPECIERAVKQAFYFLKDVAHTHQHHDQFSDTLTTANRISAGKPLTRILNHLFSFIIEIKKQNTQDRQFSAKGILQYAKTFLLIAENAKSEEIPDYHFENLEQSIQVNITGTEAIRREKRSTAAWHSVPFIASITFFLSYVTLYTRGVGHKEDAFLDAIQCLPGAANPHGVDCTPSPPPGRNDILEAVLDFIASANSFWILAALLIAALFQYSLPLIGAFFTSTTKNVKKILITQPKIFWVAFFLSLILATGWLILKILA